jgi:predicted dehydrogenase
MWNISRLRWARPGQSETTEELDHRDGADLGYRAETEHFIECLRQDRAPDVTVADGLAALEVSVALKRSARSSQAAVPASTVPWPHRD